MKKFKLAFCIIFVLFLVVGCSNSDKKLIDDTTELLTNSNLPPEVKFEGYIPESMKVGQDIEGYANFENIGGGEIIVFGHHYKNDQYTSTLTTKSVFKNGIKGGTNLDPFDSTINPNIENSFASPGIYKYEFAFYDCQDIIEKYNTESCNISYKTPTKLENAGLVPLKIETLSTQVTN
ncbi:hypothetical protein HOB30_01920 [Candidatus Falkowbacteria bacterium]|nr:hypothetical protein [Candidatus Falkowbacteria bacterium]